MAESLRVSFGCKTSDNSPYLFDLTSAPHLLVGGTTGSGKSNFLHSIVSQLLGRMSPKRINLYISDPKRVEFSDYVNAPQVIAISKTPEENLYMFKNLVSGMEQRFKCMATRRLKCLINKSFEPNVLVVIDEYADIILDKKHGKEISPLVTRLTQIGRAAGITVVIATQHPVVTIVDSSIKANCATRICFKVNSAVNSQVILGRKSNGEMLDGCGKLILCSPYERELIEIQTGYITQDFIDYQIRLAEEKYKRVAVNYG